MNLPQQVFVNVSGVDLNAGAAIVFVWCRNKGPTDYRLVGSGHIVDVPADVRPPGIQHGEYSVTFLLPSGCSVDDVFVTDDKNGNERLTGVTVTAGLGGSKTPLLEGVSIADAPSGPRISPAFRNPATASGRS